MRQQGASFRGEEKDAFGKRLHKRQRRAASHSWNSNLVSALFVFAATLSSADGMICNTIGTRNQVSPSSSALYTTHQPFYDDDDEAAFRSLYQETNAEGVSLGKEFEQRQVQLEKDRKRLAETFEIDASMNSASLFNTANAVVISTPSMRRSNRRRNPTPTPAENEDNWALILCTSLSAQLSQQAAVLQDLYPTQLLQHQQQQELLQKKQTAVIFACVLAAVFASGGGYLEMDSPQPQIPSMNSFHF